MVFILHGGGHDTFLQIVRMYPKCRFYAGFGWSRLFCILSVLAKHSQQNLAIFSKPEYEFDSISEIEDRDRICGLI